MNTSDAAQILTLVSVYDNRQFDDVTARVWADALEGLELGDCLDAVRQYYRQTRTWLMPSDLRQQARTILVARRELEAKRAERLAIEQANQTPEVVSERVQAIRDAVSAAKTVPDEPSPHPSQDELMARKGRSVPCTWCKAPERQPCVNTATGMPARITHDIRLEDAGLIPRRPASAKPSSDPVVAS